VRIDDRSEFYSTFLNLIFIGIQNIMHGRKIEYSIHKLKEEDKKRKEEEENSAREVRSALQQTIVYL
jgi:hypothetical protein